MVKQDYCGWDNGGGGLGAYVECINIPLDEASEGFVRAHQTNRIVKLFFFVCNSMCTV